MRTGKAGPADKAPLRRRAEEQLGYQGEKRPADDQDRMAHLKTERLFHELQVHQIELEMQNEELRTSRAGVEESRTRYEELYDFSPLAYFTFDRAGLIKAINLTGAQLLGKERGSLVGSAFSRFIDPESLNVFLSHLDAVFEDDTKQSCELSLATEEGSPVPVVMESIRIREGHGETGQCRSALLDITKRKRAEDELKRSEERLNLALTASGMGVWEWNIATGAVFWSPECFTIMGVNGFNGKLADFTDAIHPEDAARIRAAIDRALAERTAFREEFRIIRPDGEVRCLSNFGRAAYDKNGKPLIMSGTVQDITVRKRNEELLQRYELLAGHSRDIILFLDRESGHILEANAAAAKAYGYTRDELLTMTIRDLRAAETLELTAGQMAKADGQGLLFETVHRHKDGKTCPMEVSSRGATIGGRRALVSVIRDITKRKKAETALREREELFRVTFDRSPIGAAMVGTDQRITRANAELCRMLGYTEEEIAGMALRDVTHPDDIEADLENLRTLIAGRRESFTMEKRYLRKDGGIIWGQLSAGAVRDDGGRVSYVIGMIEDITERKRAEELLEKRSAQLEDANRELESFSYSVSHDLRAPLRAIDGFSRAILKKKGEQFDEETKRQFKLITDGAQRMNRLIEDILAFSRVGKQERVESGIDMDQLVRETWEEVSAIRPDGRFDLRMDRLPPCIGDRALIRQVLTNLLSNAIKYSARRDKSMVEVRGHADEKEALYSVKDNGVGFDMAYYHKLFGVFQRLHSSTEFEGTGVGLAIVQRIIHRHGGRVWAEAERDKGATFSFTLPVRQG